MARGSKKTGDDELGARVAARRKELKLTREALAEQIGASYALVAQVETGWRMPSYEKQRQIAQVLGIGFGELFGTEDDVRAARASVAGASGAPAASFDAAATARPVTDAFPLGPMTAARGRSAPTTAAASSAPSPGAPHTPAQGYVSSKPTFDQVVDRASAVLRELPASRRLDALSRLQLIAMREVADEERRRVGSGQQPEGWITELAPNEVFVFGSNPAGEHRGGASRLAYERFGAEWGQGSGRHGQSYAVVTTEGSAVLADEVAALLRYARRHPDLRFLVTAIGTGTAGYRADEVAPLFADAPDNLVLPEEFR